MQEVFLSRLKDETLEECLWRLGSFKPNHPEVKWDDIADFLNSEFDLLYGESAYRKKFKKLAKAVALQESEAVYQGDYHALTKNNLREIEKQRIRMREEQNSYRKTLKMEANLDSLLDDLRSAIKRAEPIKAQPENIEMSDNDKDDKKAIYAMLSDIHYGLTFSSYYNNYNPEIAKERVMLYADKLCEIGQKNNISDIYVSIMGDLISGSIHPTIRIENRIDVIEQVVQVSELISEFLLRLSKEFNHVYVTDVAGNHSRLEGNIDNCLRTERMDLLIPWYCKAKLENIKNIEYWDTCVDPTISVLTIFDKTYVAVHGDFDPDLKTSSQRIAQLIGKKVDYMLAGHMHVAECRIEDVGYFRNGAVVSGGDEYTSKKRLFGPAAQVCLLISKNGVEAMYPIKL